MTDTREALIAKLEAAAEGSDELDARVIAQLVNGSVEQSKFTGRWCIYTGAERSGRPRSLEPKTPNERDLYQAHGNNQGPTRSLDAALTLVPEGQWNGNIMWNFGDLRKGGFVELNCGPVSEAGTYEACVDSYEDQEPAGRKPRPLPLALCIAALKARAAT